MNPTTVKDASSDNPTAAVTARLHADFEKARLEFVKTDLDTANTFLDLARMDFQRGEKEHGSRLLQSAQRAADVVERYLKEHEENAGPSLRRRFEALRKAISEVEHLAR